LRKKGKAGDFTLLNFRKYYKATVVKTVWYQHKDRHIGQWHRTESPEMNVTQMAKVNSSLTGAKATEWGNDRLFSKWCWRTGFPQEKE
jgi:hypothetical protein